LKSKSLSFLSFLCNVHKKYDKISTKFYVRKFKKRLDICVKMCYNNKVVVQMFGK
jgi:hypothetical protein